MYLQHQGRVIRWVPYPSSAGISNSIYPPTARVQDLYYYRVSVPKSRVSDVLLAVPYPQISDFVGIRLRILPR